MNTTGKTIQHPSLGEGLGGLQRNNIYNMDCLEGMRAIPDGSVDCIICDLPYGTTHCSWDSVIPFDKLWEQYHRICKPNAAILLFGSEPFSTMVRMSNIEEFRYDWIWEKTKAADFLNAKARPLKNHEIISVFSQNGSTSMVYNPQGLRRVNKVCKNRAGKFGNSQGDWNHKANYVQEYENYPMTVQRFPNDTDTFHPTQKPVDLIRYLVLTYSNPGDLILDNCMGSGTTAIACIREKRDFIGFEMNKEYYDKYLKRIQLERMQPTFDFG